MKSPWSKALVAVVVLGGIGWGVPAALADRDGDSRHERGERYEGREGHERGERYEGREGHERHERREGDREREHDNDDDDREEHGSGPLDKKYVAECGACHVAYPPGMLPERSWRKLMGNLANHFGENAELDKAVAAELEGILVREAGRGEFADSVSGNSTPLRISETPKFLREHDELGKKPEQVKSMALCDACHTRAKEGSYAEHEIVIPGRGRWE